MIRFERIIRPELIFSIRIALFHLVIIVGIIESKKKGHVIKKNKNFFFLWLKSIGGKKKYLGIWHIKLQTIITQILNQSEHMYLLVQLLTSLSPLVYA